MKVYGAPICIDCRNYKAIQTARGFAADYVDITSSTAALREFLAIRDTADLFAPVRARGGIGIPLFVAEDGRMTLDMNEAFAWMGQPPAADAEIVERRDDAPVCAGCK